MRSSYRQLVTNLRLVSLCTLLSRVLGLARDIVMAVLFGNGLLLDAFSIAYRIPNLFRRIFGEGALTVAFLPAFLQKKKTQGLIEATRLASALLFVLTLLLVGLVVLGELGLWWSSSYFQSEEARLLIELTALLLPYVLLICLAAQLSAILHTLNHFTWPALVPVILNIVWLLGAWLAAFLFDDAWQQLWFIGGSILAGGLLQSGCQLPTLWRLGLRPLGFGHPHFIEVRTLLYGLAPVILGLSVTQLNTLSDSLIAWIFTVYETTSETTHVPTGSNHTNWKVFSEGTASALYFSQRMYQFPLGVFGVALGTVFFPRLTQHAEQEQEKLFAADMQQGSRLALFIGLPASWGLMLLTEPITRLLFEHGQFDATDTRQTASLMMAYGSGVWAAVWLILLNRAFYARHDRQTPLYIGLIAVGVNLVLNLSFIGPLGPTGLAYATSASTSLQVLLSLRTITRKLPDFSKFRLVPEIVRLLLPLAALTGAIFAVQACLPSGHSLANQLVLVFGSLGAGVAAYCSIAWFVGFRSLLQSLLLPGHFTANESETHVN